MPQRVSNVTTDHDQIREFAESRGAKPALVRKTGIIRLDFPGYSGEDKLQTISWDDWFERFEESHLALVYEESTARGQRSNFNKLIGRETVDLDSGKLKAPPRRRAKQGARTQKDARRIRASRVSSAGRRKRASRAGDAAESERSSSRKAGRKSRSGGTRSKTTRKTSSPTRTKAQKKTRKVPARSRTKARSNRKASRSASSSTRGRSRPGRSTERRTSPRSRNT